MKKTERILAILTLIAIIFKLLRWPGGGILLIISLSFLSLLYYLSFALFNDIRFRDVFNKSSYAGISAKRIIGAEVLGLSFSLILIGILFKAQLWPGGGIQLGTGLFFTGIILIVALIYNSRNKANFYKGIFRRIAIIGGFGLLIFMTSTDTIIDTYYPDQPEYREAFKKAVANPQDQSLWDEVDRLRVERLKGELNERYNED